MNKLIMCEGKTDAILLSYYLDHTCGWKHCKAPKGLDIVVDEKRSETAEWYNKGSDFLLICAVGSKSNFKFFFQNRIYRPLHDSSAFSKIALIIDHDDERIIDIVEKVKSELSEIASHATVDQWVQHTYSNAFGDEILIDFLLVIIPVDRQGALETLLLEVISENAYDRNIVEKSCEYINLIAPEAKLYLCKKRLVTKAYLGVTWAIQSPEKVFSFIDEQIRQVQWETSTTLHECFANLIEI